MEKLTKREGVVNYKLLSRLRGPPIPAHDGAVAAFDMRELFRQFIRELVDTAGHGDASFARASGIKASLLSAMNPGKGRLTKMRGGTWKQIQMLVDRGIVTPAEIFSRLYELAQANEHPNVAKVRELKLQREVLRQRLASAELHERAAADARARQKDGPPSRPGLTGRLQDRRTGAKG